MPRYRVNFNDFALGTAPSSSFVWRQNNGSGAADIISGGQQGKQLRTNATTGGTKILSYVPLNNVNDVEICVCFTLQRDVGKQGIFALRYSGTNEATMLGYAISGSFISNQGTLATDEGGTGYQRWTAWNYLPNIKYWAKFRVVGSNIKAKVWTDGQAEPGWMLDYDDTLRPTTQYAGFHQYNTGYIYYEYFSYGTNGDYAPLPGQSLVDINYAELRRFDGTNFVQKPIKIMRSNGTVATDKAHIMVNGDWRIIR